MGARPRVVHRSKGLTISTNIAGFKWPSPAEQIDGLLDAGLIDEAEAARLHANLTTPTEPQP